MAETVGPSRTPRVVDAGLSEQESLPRPTLAFQRRAWREFQRALDPLAWPKPLKPRRPTGA